MRTIATRENWDKITDKLRESNNAADHRLAEHISDRTCRHTWNTRIEVDLDGEDTGRVNTIAESEEITINDQPPLRRDARQKSTSND